jgi:hypothetical protein
MEPQNQSVWDKLPKAAKIILGLIGAGLFLALLVLQAKGGGTGFACH